MLPTPYLLFEGESMNEIIVCCADCGKEEGGGVSLKACTACMLVMYCNADCQRNHWPKHKKECKERAAELRDEALFKEPPAKEECPICFLPMLNQLLACISLPPATIMSVPISDYEKNEANEELASKASEQYYSCCGKSICRGCVYSFGKSGNSVKCPFCNERTSGKTDEEAVAEMMKRSEAKDAGAMCQLGCYYYDGSGGLQQDRTKAFELWKQAAELGDSQAHYQLGDEYHEEGDLKKAKFHYETAAMAGHEVARYFLGYLEHKLGNKERAVKHWKIAASSGNYHAMSSMLVVFKKGLVSRESIDSTLAAYNTSCADMRSEARDAYIQIIQERE
jgi:tetratricopeptide (TPR) repeat protein